MALSAVQLAATSAAQMNEVCAWIRSGGSSTCRDDVAESRRCRRRRAGRPRRTRDASARRCSCACRWASGRPGSAASCALLDLPLPVRSYGGSAVAWRVGAPGVATRSEGEDHRGACRWYQPAATIPITTAVVAASGTARPAHREHAGQVVPRTVRAHLDDVARHVGGPTLELGQLVLRTDAAAEGRQARAEDVRDEDDVRRPRRSGTRSRWAHRARGPPGRARGGRRTPRAGPAASCGTRPPGLAAPGGSRRCRAGLRAAPWMASGRNICLVRVTGRPARQR